MPSFLDSFRQFFAQDARHFQIAYLGGFLIFGILFLDWEADLSRYLITIFGCLSVQFLFAKLWGKDLRSLKSGLITALGLCLLFKANLLWIILLAAALSIASKFLIRIKGKHVFNPANFGIVLAILLTGNGWVSPGQWGNGVILLFVLGALGSIILLKVGRLDTSIAFIGTLALLEFGRTVLYYGWPIDHFLHQFTNGALLLFTFFMITDPVTTPNAPIARWGWGSAIGVLSFVLTGWFYINTAPIIALFVMAPITAVLDRYFKAPSFSWYPSTANNKTAIPSC